MKYIGNLNLANQEDYQAIYASQLYGTFFSVFGKFTCQSVGKDEYTLDKIEFKIINYKGVINLGISNVRGIFDITDTNGNQFKAMNIEIQGLNGNEEFELDCSGVVLKKNELFITERTLIKMHSGTALNNGVFDDEFYYREGVANADGLFPEKSPAPMSTFDHNTLFEEFPGSVCPRATNRII